VNDVNAVNDVNNDGLRKRFPIFNGNQINYISNQKKKSGWESC